MKTIDWCHTCDSCQSLQPDPSHFLPSHSFALFSSRKQVQIETFQTGKLRAETVRQHLQLMWRVCNYRKCLMELQRGLGRFAPTHTHTNTQGSAAQEEEYGDCYHENRWQPIGATWPSWMTDAEYVHVIPPPTWQAGDAICAEVFAASPFHLFRVFSLYSSPDLFPTFSLSYSFFLSLSSALSSAFLLFSISEYIQKYPLDRLERPCPWQCVTLTTQQQTPSGTLTSLSCATEINGVFSPLDEGGKEREGCKG